MEDDKLTETGTIDETVTENLISIPSFLALPTNDGIAVASDTGTACGQGCYGQLCGQDNCCTTYCSQYWQNGQPCYYGETCGEGCFEGDCGESCGQNCGESSGDDELQEGSIFSLSSTKDSITIVFAAIPGATSYVIYYRPSTASAALTINTTNTSCTITGLEKNTEYVVNYRGSKNGVLGPLLTTPESSRTIKTKSGDEWEWWSNIASGLPIAISADEWNAFCTFINETRLDNGLSTYAFTTVSKGTLIQAFLMNQARSAIAGISGHGTLPVEVKAGHTITAQYFIDLADAVNAAV